MTDKPEPLRSLVVCVGNDLVADDAAGPAVYAALFAQGLPAWASLRLLGVGGLALLDELQGEDLLVAVDAVQLGAPAGTVHVFEFDELPKAGPAVTSHGIGLREAIEVGRRLYPERMPRRVALVGIEGRCFDGLGEPMSPEVAAAIPKAAARVRALVGEGASVVPRAGR